MELTKENTTVIEDLIKNLNSYRKDLDKLKFLDLQPKDVTAEIARVLGCENLSEPLLYELTEIKNSWATDPVVFEALHREFNFSVDAAASDDNHKCELYFTKEDNALAENWSECMEAEGVSKTVWINPPYGKGLIQLFMEKCVEQKALGVTSVLLVPATLDAQWLPLEDVSEIRMVTRGRLAFIHPLTGKKISGNNKGSMFVIFRPNENELKWSHVDRAELLRLGS